MNVKTGFLKSFSETMGLIGKPAVLTVLALFFTGCVLSHSFSGSEMTDTNPVVIEGVYECRGRNYQGATIIRKKGDAYQLNWKINQQSFYGIGIRENDMLSASWFDGKGTAGVVVYKIEAGPILRGKYSTFSGDGTIRTETLRFKRDLIPSDDASNNRIEI